MVIIVLLNVELTWATPDEMFLRSRRRTRVASLAMFVLSIDLYAAVVPAATPGRQSDFGSRNVRLPTHDCRLPPITSSCRRWPSPDPCGCGRWCACAGREPAASGDDAGRGSSRGPSGA